VLPKAVSFVVLVVVEPLMISWLLPVTVLYYGVLAITVSVAADVVALPCEFVKTARYS
jgi:hypothetical protein